MCTACIEAQHMQKIIKVKTKRTTKPFELVHSDVSGPFPMPTSAGHRNNILFIDDYIRYTSVLVIPDKKSKTCTSAYQSFQTQGDYMRYEVKRFRCDTGRREYNNQHSDWCLLLMPQHTNHVLPMLTLRMGLPNA
jgi:hypothetical protein